MRRVVLLLGLLAAGFAGCGGDDEATEQKGVRKDGPTPSKREFIAKADRICAQLERRSKRLGNREPESPEELVRLARRTTALHQDGVRLLEGIGLPAQPDARRGAQQYLDAIRAMGRPVRALEGAANQVETAADKDSEEAGEAAVLNLQEALIDLEQVDDRSHTIARRYGLKDCAEEDETDEEEPPKPGRKREPS